MFFKVELYHIVFSLKIKKHFLDKIQTKKDYKYGCKKLSTSNYKISPYHH